ncbi:hypothetical protein GCM10022410_05220 [Amphibacillus indicireducens]|uniref:Uncharacterized protein n=1 Tax=Amphibacillus indicireducens TaxID=1076330 RepID=A0ABP7V7V6_9BACI
MVNDRPPFKKEDFFKKRVDKIFRIAILEEVIENDYHCQCHNLRLQGGNIRNEERESF